MLKLKMLGPEVFGSKANGLVSNLGVGSLLLSNILPVVKRPKPLVVLKFPKMEGFSYFLSSGLGDFYFSFSSCPFLAPLFSPVREKLTLVEVVVSGLFILSILHEKIVYFLSLMLSVSFSASSSAGGLFLYSRVCSSISKSAGLSRFPLMATTTTIN